MFPPISEKASSAPLLPSLKPGKSRRRARKSLCSTCMILLIFSAFVDIFLLISFSKHWLISRSLTSKGLEACAWSTLESQVPLLDVPPISRSEFLTRQSTLASALQKAGIDAFISEPSASSAYYANISTSYSLSERPFLMILSSNGNLSYLAPKFELGRIARLEMVAESKKVIEWREEESPYEVLRSDTGFKKVMLDEHARYMIASGLQGVGIDVVPMTKKIQSLRAVKSQSEIQILKAINAFTLQLVRSLQGCIKIGMSQETIQTAAHGLFTRAGLGEGYWALVLFGEQAANPHGGSKGNVLKDGEFILIDIGSSLHSYGSDVTRTFLPAHSSINPKLLDIWYTVYAAQSAAIELMKVNQTCSVIDAASRRVIEDKGLGEFFTHRLGHGLGLEMHEHPYLNGANGEVLKVGEVVTNEPGVYVTGEQADHLGWEKGLGVRIEDAVLVTEEEGVVMTGARARSPWEP